MNSTLVRFVLARLKEPSSYAGLGAVVAAIGLHLSATQLDSVISILVAAAGAAAVFLPEQKG